MSRAKSEAKEKDQGYALFHASMRPLYGAPIWPSITSRYTEEWQSISTFLLMQYSELRDRKRTPEYPEGQSICSGDIIQFSINLDGKDTEVKDIVVFDYWKNGWFVIADLDDEPLAMYNDECEVIGTIYEQPDLLGWEAQKIRKLLKEYRLE